MTHFDVFLSHSSDDKPWVSQLKVHLLRYNISVWLDQDEIRPGDLFAEALEQALDNCRAVALIVSPEAVASGWVKEEYCRALSLSQDKQVRLRLIPVLLREAQLPGFLQNRSWVDFRDETVYNQNVWRLVWGITGQKPDKVLDLSSPDDAPTELRIAKEVDELKYSAIIQSHIDALENEWQEIDNLLSRLQWRKDRLEKQVATYEKSSVPVRILEDLRKTSEKIKELENTLEGLEIEKNRFVSDLEETLALERDRYKSISGEELNPTVDNLQRLIDEGEALLIRGDEGIVPGLASKYRKQAQLAQDNGDYEIAVRPLNRAGELYRKIGDESNFLETQHILVNLLIKEGDKLISKDPKLALEKYLHAQDLSRHLKEREPEIRILGILARFHEMQSELGNAIIYRLDLIDWFIDLDQKIDICSEIKSIRSLCRKLVNSSKMKEAHNLAKETYQLTKKFFGDNGDLDGLDILKSLVDSCQLDYLRNEIEKDIRALKEEDKTPQDAEKRPETSKIDKIRDELKVLKQHSEDLEKEISRFPREEDAPLEKVNSYNSLRIVIRNLEDSLWEMERQEA